VIIYFKPNQYWDCEILLEQSHAGLSICELSFRTGCRARRSRS